MDEQQQQQQNEKHQQIKNGQQQQHRNLTEGSPKQSNGSFWLLILKKWLQN